MPVFSFLDRIAGLSSLDPALQRVASLADAVPSSVRDLLHGVWLGHPLHPATAQVPVGAWLGAVVLDGVAALPTTDPSVRAGLDRGASVLVATGLATTPSAALPGLMDWARLHPEQQRVGAVHAVGNLVGTALMAASLVARRRGRTGRGRLLSLGGVAVAGVSAGIGGHLAYRYASGANHAEGVGHVTTQQWTEIGMLDRLPEREPVAAVVGDTDVVVVRRGRGVDVLADVCSHLSGPLSGGVVSTERGVDCVVCPWHASAFEVSSGAVMHGPATAPQPVFDVQVVDGVVSARVRPPEAFGAAGHRALGTVV